MSSAVTIMAKTVDMRSLNLEDYDYDYEEACSVAKATKRAPRMKAVRKDQTRTKEAREASAAAKYSDDQILAKQELNRELNAKKAARNRAAIAAKKREENGGSYRFKGSKQDRRSDRRRG